MTDEYTDFDAAYVLGALSEMESAAFERHLLGCDECSRAVDELTGILPALAAAPESAFAPDPAPPVDLLPRMLRTVRHQRNRRRWIAAAATTLAAACLVLLTVVITGSSNTTAATPAGHSVAMTALVPAPISATADVSTVAWGTKIKLTCTYNNQVQYPATDDYALMVVDKQGVSHELGTWQIVPGRVTNYESGTSLARSDISSINITTVGGTPVLQLKG